MAKKEQTMSGYFGDLIRAIIIWKRSVDLKPAIRRCANVSLIIAMLGAAGSVLYGLLYQIAERIDDPTHWTVRLTHWGGEVPWMFIVMMVPGIVFIVLRELGITPWVGWR